jgi:RNA polymerase sigma factor (sigma-70 family)
MEAVVDRKEDALECIYERYESLLRTVILNVIRDEADVEDVLHDVMLQLWEQGHRYNSNEKGVRGLLVTLARRRSLDRLRRRAAYLRATESLKSDTGNPLRFEASPRASQVEINDLSELPQSRHPDIAGSTKRSNRSRFFQRDESTRNRR